MIMNLKNRLKEKLREIYYNTGYIIVGFIMFRLLKYKECMYWTEIPNDVTQLMKWEFHLEFIR